METIIYNDSAPYFTTAEYLQVEPISTEIVVSKLKITSQELTHSHDDIELILVTSGKGNLIINGVSHEIYPGSMAHLLPYHIHSIHPNKGQTLQIYCCRFSLAALMTFSIARRYQNKERYIFEFGSPVVYLNKKEAADIKSNFDNIELENIKSEEMHEILSLSILMQTIFIFQRKCLKSLEKNTVTIRGLAWNILQYLQINFSNNLDSALVAKKFGIKINEVNKTLKLLTGENFSQNLHRTRIRNACAMMLFNDLSIQYIGHYVGYSTAAAFYREFKKIKCVTPDNYRKKHTIEAKNTPHHISYNIILYIMQNYRDSITLKRASKDLLLSPSKIENLLQVSYGSTFFQMLCSIRIQYACSLLYATKLPISNIAYSVGFTSIRTFTRCFKEKMGTTATLYRKSKLD